MTLGLALFSCDKSEPVNRTNGGDLLGEPTRFEMTSSLGAVGIESLSSNTDKADDELRANLHFNGLSSVATTTLDATKFGATQNHKAYWGVRYGANLSAVEECDDAISAEPANPNDLKKSTVYFKGTEASTILNKEVKMYAVSNTKLPNITKGIMLLEGKAEGTKLYFTSEKNTEPNARIEGVANGAFQADRHIPIMTDVVDFADMEAGSANNAQVKFAPRGSLIGLNIKNRTGEQMIVTGIVVPKAGALSFAGYFDWSQNGKPSFTEDYGTNNESALVFPVFDGATAGYTIANGNTDMSCFFVWGFQKATQKGDAFQVQIRYKKSATDPEETTRTFNVYAPTSKVNTSEKLFDDGYAYNVVLTVNPSNKVGGSTGTDWNNGGTLTTGLNPLLLVAEYDIAKVAEPITLDPNRQLQFVTNHNVKANGGAYVNDYAQFQEGTDVGLYTWAEAMRLFGYDVADNTAPVYNPNKVNQDGFNGSGWKAGDGWSDALLTKSELKERKYKTITGQDYYLPNDKEVTAILPYYIDNNQSLGLQGKRQTTNKNLQLVSFTKDWNDVLSAPFTRTLATKASGLQNVQIGRDILLAGDYEDTYITKEEGGQYVTYAIRFKGTKYESAWRYEYKQVDVTNGGPRLIVKNLMLGKNSSKTLTDGANCIATEAFFNSNSSVVERIFPAYGYIWPKYNGDRWTSTLSSWYGSYDWYFNSSGGLVTNSRRLIGFALRPFIRN